MFMVRCIRYNIRFVSDLQQVGLFSLGAWVSSTNKTDYHDKTEILLKVALNTITHNPNPNSANRKRRHIIHMTTNFPSFVQAIQLEKNVADLSLFYRDRSPPKIISEDCT